MENSAPERCENRAAPHYFGPGWSVITPIMPHWTERTLLKGGVAVAEEGIAIRRALPHGHAAAVLGTIRAIGLDRLLGKPTHKRLAPLTIAS